MKGFTELDRDNVIKKQRIFTMALNWRRALYQGRFDQAASRLESLAIMIDDYLEQQKEKP